VDLATVYLGADSKRANFHSIEYLPRN